MRFFSSKSDLATYVVQFVVEAAGVAYGVTIPIAPPKSSSRCLAVSAAGAGSSSSGLGERKIRKINVMVKTVKQS